MADGAGFFASNGRLFVDGWRAMGPALATTWARSRPDMALNVVGAAISTFGFGTPIGYAPEYAPVGGYKPTSLGSRGGAWIDGLFR